MNINYKTKNLVLDEEIKNYLEDKIGSLIEKYLLKLDEKENIQIDCEVSRETHHQKGNIYYVEVNMELPGRIIRAAKYHSDIRSGIDEVENDLKRQIKKYREINRAKTRKDWLKLKNFIRGIFNKD